MLRHITVSRHFITKYYGEHYEIASNTATKYKEDTETLTSQPYREACHITQCDKTIV